MSARWLVAFFALLPVMVVGASADTLEVELFVMSQCPHGVEAEKSILNALDLLGYPDEVRLSIYFICQRKGKRWVSLHGEVELEENKRQLVIKRFFPNRFFDYLKSRLTHYYDDSWRKDALVAGIPLDSVEVLVERYGAELLDQNARVALERGIESSPTLFVNGVKVEDWKSELSGIWALFAKAAGRLDPDVCYSDISCFDFSRGEFGVCVRSASDSVGRCVFGDEAQKYLAKRSAPPSVPASPPSRAAFEETPPPPRFEIPEGATLIAAQSFDFGVIPERYPVRHIFTFKNTTTDTLVFAGLGAVSGGRGIGYALNTSRYDGRIDTLRPGESYVVSVFLRCDLVPKAQSAVAGTVAVLFEGGKYAQFAVSAKFGEWELVEVLQCPGFNLCDSSCADAVQAGALRLKNISRDTIKVLIKDFPFDMYSDVSVDPSVVPPGEEFLLVLHPLFDYNFTVYSEIPVIFDVVNARTGARVTCCAPLQCRR